MRDRSRLLKPHLCSGFPTGPRVGLNTHDGGDGTPCNVAYALLKCRTGSDEASAGQQNVQLKELDSPLRSAVTASHPELVQRLLRGRADVNGKDPDSCVSDTRGVTPLHLAVFKGRQHIVNMLLSAAADANARDCHGQSPIFFAPSRQICETLMARSADLGLVNIRNQTPLHLLARAGQESD
eukprot:s5626_g5.t1